MKIKLKYMLQKRDHLEEKSIFWNMLFSILSSLQSAVMLLIVTRVNGAEEAGILSIAYAISYLMYTIGTFGVRNFHVTDSQIYYCYNDYKKIRIISGGFMVISSLLSCVYKGYEAYKKRIILAMCLLKLLEAIEDLYHGELQRMGRLDLAGFLGTIRLGLNYFVCFLILLLTKNLFLAIGSMIFFSFLIIVINKIILEVYLIGDDMKKKGGKWIKLLTSCFPLFITLFLSIYIGNSPKYAIDACLSEKEQAYYAIISMPVFTINLLSGILYRPQLLSMAKVWNEKDRRTFKNIILKQLRNILIIAIMILVCGLTLGLKILEIFYGLSLVSLKKEFALLLIGGGMTAGYNFLTVCITIMRKQSFMITLSIFIMVLAYTISNKIVGYAGLTGASYLYLILMACEMIILSIALLIYLKKGMKEK